MTRTWKATLGAIALAVSSGLHADVLPANQTDSAWYTDAQAQLLEKLATNNQFKAKNVILFVGDGMGVSPLPLHAYTKGNLKETWARKAISLLKPFLIPRLLKHITLTRKPLIQRVP